MKMRSRKNRWWFMVYQNSPGSPPFRGGMHVVYRHEVVGHDEHNSWASG